MSSEPSFVHPYIAALILKGSQISREGERQLQAGQR